MMQSSLSSLLLSAKQSMLTIQWSQLIVLIKMHFYVLMRRRLVLLLLVFLILGCFVNVGIQYLLYSLGSHSTSNTSCIVSSSSTTHHQSTTCIVLPKEQIQQQNIMRQDILRQTQMSLTFPTSIQLGGNTDEFLGVFLLCLLASLFVGNDYRLGILRLTFARGTSRRLFVFSQICVLGLFALGFTLLLFISSAAIGLLIGPSLGGHLQLPSWNGWKELFLYELILAWELWASALIVLLLTTLGQSTTTGIIGICSYWALQLVVWPTLQSTLIPILPAHINGVVRYIPTLFIHTNIGTLLTAVSTHPIEITSSGGGNLITPLVGCILLVCYSSGCILSTFLLLQKRDVLA
jgi:hypothetical protein